MHILATRKEKINEEIEKMLRSCYDKQTGRFLESRRCIHVCFSLLSATVCLTVNIPTPITKLARATAPTTQPNNSDSQSILHYTTKPLHYN